MITTNRWLAAASVALLLAGCADVPVATMTLLPADVSRSGTSASSRGQQSGLQCPSCGFTIKFTMMDLVLRNSITCPSCRLTMSMEVPVELNPQNNK